MQHTFYTCDSCEEQIDGSPENVLVELYRGKIKAMRRDLCNDCRAAVLNAFGVYESRDALEPIIRG